MPMYWYLTWLTAVCFVRDEVIAHKTFHRYTVRAKRGTAQGSRDKQGNAPHSAGASLRRYNESALTEVSILTYAYRNILPYTFSERYKQGH